MTTCSSCGKTLDERTPRYRQDVQVVQVEFSTIRLTICRYCAERARGSITRQIGPPEDHR